MARAPKERPCSDCGRTILSAQTGRALCPECKAKARRAAYWRYNHSEKGRANSRRSSKAWRERYPERAKESRRKNYWSHVEERRAASRAYYAAHIEFERLRGRLGSRARRGDRKAAFELGRLTGRMKTCPRLHVTASSLPCGQRMECWGGKPCEHCAGMKRPKIEINDWGF